MNDAPDLRIKHNWLAVGGFVLAAAATAWGVAQWAATTPKRAEFERVQWDVTDVKLNIATMKGDIKAVQDTGTRTEKSIDNISVKVDQLVQRRR